MDNCVICSEDKLKLNGVKMEKKSKCEAQAQESKVKIERSQNWLKNSIERPAREFNWSKLEQKSR